MPRFKGNYAYLSLQKFSSHVVEKCIKDLEESRPIIIREILSVPRFSHLLQHPYANYVILSALNHTKVSQVVSNSYVLQLASLEFASQKLIK